MLWKQKTLWLIGLIKGFLYKFEIKKEEGIAIKGGKQVASQLKMAIIHQPALAPVSSINKNTQGAKKGEANQKQQLSSR